MGADGFEPPKVKTSRFTVCPIWPLWNTPNIYFNVRFGASCRIRTNDPEITNHVLWPTELKRRVMQRFFATPFYTSAEKRCKGSAFFSTDKIFYKSFLHTAILPSSHFCSRKYLTVFSNLELMAGVEPATSSLPRMRSTTELHQQHEHLVRTTRRNTSV